MHAMLALPRPQRNTSSHCRTPCLAASLNQERKGWKFGALHRLHPRSRTTTTPGPALTPGPSPAPLPTRPRRYARTTRAVLLVLFLLHNPARPHAKYIPAPHTTAPHRPYPPSQARTTRWTAPRPPPPPLPCTPSSTSSFTNTTPPPPLSLPPSRLGRRVCPPHALLLPVRRPARCLRLQRARHQHPPGQ